MTREYVTTKQAVNCLVRSDGTIAHTQDLREEKERAPRGCKWVQKMEVKTGYITSTGGMMVQDVAYEGVTK